MNGGKIYNNKAERGGGVYLFGAYKEDTKDYTSEFTMNGGTIDNNAANDYGGGVYVKDSTFT